MKKEKKKLNITESDVLVLSESKGDFMGSVIRIVRYTVNEKAGEKLLEKKTTFGKVMGKRAGFTLEDFEFILKNKEKILEGLK